MKDSVENFGEFFMGDRIENFLYRFKMYINEIEIFMCNISFFLADEFKFLKKRIDEMY